MPRRRRYAYRRHAHEIAVFQQLSPRRQSSFLHWLRRLLAAWLGKPAKRERQRPRLRVL